MMSDLQYVVEAIQIAINDVKKQGEQSTTDGFSVDVYEAIDGYYAGVVFGVDPEKVVWYYQALGNGLGAGSVKAVESLLKNDDDSLGEIVKIAEYLLSENLIEKIEQTVVKDKLLIEKVLAGAWLKEGHGTFEDFKKDSDWAVYDCGSSVAASRHKTRDDCYIVDQYIAVF